MLDVQAPPDMGNIIRQQAQEFSSMMTTVLTTINSAVVEISRVAYVTIPLLGLPLHFTHVDRRRGKDLAKGGVIPTVLSEFVFPGIIGL